MKNTNKPLQSFEITLVAAMREAAMIMLNAPDENKEYLDKINLAIYDCQLQRGRVIDLSGDPDGKQPISIQIKGGDTVLFRGSKYRYDYAPNTPRAYSVVFHT